MDISWLTAFLDLPASTHQVGTEFWTAASGQVLSASRGEDDEFATLLPIGGDDFLRVQRLGSGGPRVHLDLHAADVAAAGERAEGLGAKLIAATDYSTYLSPGGMPFCIVRQPNSVRPGPARWGDHTSLLDQVCLDIPAGRFEEEATFWSELLALESRAGRSGEFVVLQRPADQPLRVLLQRLDELDGPVRAHLDIATDDRPAEAGRLVELGAVVVRETAHWTTLRDPAGSEFCVTDRDPVTGVLA